MVNPDYKVEAISILLNETCILKGYYPLIPYRDALVTGLKQLGIKTKSDAMACSDQVLLQAGAPDLQVVALFRRFLGMYDPKPQKMREIACLSISSKEAAAFRELYLLPGVKSTRARLYTLAGFDSLEKIAETTPETLISACERVVTEQQLSMKAPLLKEVRTHIAVSKAFMDLLAE